VHQRRLYILVFKITHACAYAYTKLRNKVFLVKAYSNIFEYAFTCMVLTRAETN